MLGRVIMSNYDSSAADAEFAAEAIQDKSQWWSERCSDRGVFDGGNSGVIECLSTLMLSRSGACCREND